MKIIQNGNEDVDAQSHLVTAIKPAVKNQHRANIFIDDEYSFSLDLAQLVDLKLKVGQRLDDAQIVEYKNLSEFGKLYQRTLEWTLTRPHSERELNDYLKRKQLRRAAENRLRATRPEPLKALPEIREQDAQKIIKMLLEKGYVDDQKFAEYYVENRMVKKGISQRRLKQELFKKGVASNIIEQVLGDSLRNDNDEIKKIILKKQSKYSKEKLIQYLTRQGFDYQAVKSLVDETD